MISVPLKFAPEQLRISDKLNWQQAGARGGQQHRGGGQKFADEGLLNPDEYPPQGDEGVADGIPTWAYIAAGAVVVGGAVFLLRG